MRELFPIVATLLVLSFLLFLLACDTGPDWDAMEARPLTQEELSQLNEMAERVKLGEVVTSESRTDTGIVKTASQTAVYMMRGTRLWTTTT